MCGVTLCIVLRPSPLYSFHREEEGEEEGRKEVLENMRHEAGNMYIYAVGTDKKI